MRRKLIPFLVIIMVLLSSWCVFADNEDDGSDAHSPSMSVESEEDQAADVNADAEDDLTDADENQPGVFIGDPEYEEAEPNPDGSRWPDASTQQEQEEEEEKPLGTHSPYALLYFTTLVTAAFFVFTLWLVKRRRRRR